MASQAVVEKRVAKAISECNDIMAGKFKGENIPDSNRRLANLTKTALEALATAREEITDLKKDVSELKQLKPLVEGVQEKVESLGEKLEGVVKEVSGIGDKMSGLNTEIQKLQESTDSKLENNTTALDKAMTALTAIQSSMEEEREARVQEKRAREEAQEAYQRSCVAPCLIIYGLAMEEAETIRALQRTIDKLIFEVIGVNREEVQIEKVMRFGKSAEAGTGEAGTGEAGGRPRPVRIVLASPSMKTPIFKGLIKLKGKQEYRRVSVQNEIPSILMPRHKILTERAKSIRADTGCRTRIEFGKGPLVLKVLYEGQYRPEEEFTEMWNNRRSNRENPGGRVSGGSGGSGNSGNFAPRWDERT